MSAHPLYLSRRRLRTATAVVATVATVALFGLTTLPANAATLSDNAPASAGPSMVRLIIRTATAQDEIGATSLVARGGGVKHRSLNALRALVVEVPAAAAAGMQKRYEALAGVTSVELDHTRKMAAAAPDDPAYPDQWALPKIGWDTAPAVTGAATIAVLDTGVDGANPDLSARLVPGWSAFFAADGTTPADPAQDPNGHGTWLSSIAAAATNNGAGIAGVAGSGAKIMPVQVLGADGLGQDSDVSTGLIYAADHGADVILMGFSNPTYSQVLQDAVEYAWSKGAVVVAATGNDGATTPTYPAGDAKVMGVSATDTADALWSGSNSGEDTFIGAPGVGVLADAVGGGTRSVTGTSASAALVAGAAALLKGADRTATPGTIVGRLARNADPAGTVADTGNGRLNVARALADTSAAEVVPVGTNGALSGGPFVGPYLVAAFNVLLQGQSSIGAGVPSGTWIASQLQNWKEVQQIPVRLSMTGGPSTNTTITVTVPHQKTTGTTVTPGLKDLHTYTASAGTTFNGPTISGIGTDTWTYTFSNVSITGVTGQISFFTEMLAGAHNLGGSSLALGGTPSLGSLQIQQPGAAIGSPNLSVVKSGPSSVLPGTTLTYGLAYANSVTAASAATGVQLTDTLPPGATYVDGSCTATCSVSGNLVTWDLGSLAVGASGSKSLQVTIPSGVAFGTTYTDTARILSAEDDANTADNTSSVTSTVAFNRVPVAVNNAYGATEDSDLTTATLATGVLGNDTDADGNTLTATKVTNPLHGAVTLNANGTFTYTPTANYNGPDSFTYKANDGSADSNTATVNITVAPVNDAPNASSGTVSVVAGGSSAVTLVGSDVETAAGSLTYTIGTPPSHGTLTGAGSSRTYTPAAGYTGTDSFTFTVTDRGDPDNCGTVVAGTCTAALTSSPATVSVTVTAQGTSTSVTPATATYGDASVALSALVSAGAGTANAGSVTFTVKSGATTIGTATSGNVNGSGQASVSYAVPAGTPAGSYTVAATYNPGGGFSGSTATGALTVSRAPLAITAADASKVYGAANPALTGSITGIRNGDEITASYSTVASAASAVGTYAIVPAAVDGSPATLANYTVTLTNGTLSVGRAALTVTADDQTRAYGAANPALTVSYGGFVLGQNASVLGGTLTVVTPATAASVVGSYVISAAGQTSANYTIGYVPGALSVTKAPLSVTADNQTKVYGTANPVLTGTLTGVLNGDAITASYSTLADATSSVGNYGISAALADPDSKLGNYTLTTNPGVLSVTAAALVVTPAAASRIYGSANPVFTGTITGVVNGDGITATYATTATAGSPVAGYPITATLVDPNTKVANYAVTLNTAVLTVGQAALSVVVASANKSYGAVNPPLTGTFVGVVNSDAITVSYSTTATLFSGVGSYPITATLADPGTKLGNYSLTNIPGQLVVSRAELVVTANNATRTYGSENPTLDGVVTGIQNGDAITATYATDADATSPVGPYAIIPTLHGDTTNYTVQVNNGTLSVTKAALSVTAANKTKVYGTANPALTGTLTGVLNGDAITASYSTSADPTSSVGNYAITAALADPDSKLGNYQVANTPGTLSITRAALVVTPAGATRAYGAANPAFTGTITGVVNGDGITATYASSATPASAVGTYDITATLVDPNSKAGNYAVTLNTGTLTVERAALSVVVDDKTKTYGAANPTLTGTLTGLLNSDPITVSYATTATAASHVLPGGYPITATLADPGNKLGNYTLTNTPATLTITRAALTVTADNKTKVYGDANPPFTITYDTLVNSDTPAALGGTLTYDTTANTSTGVGTHPITPSGLTSGDYTITYAPGQLTITRAALTITAASKAKTYGDANPALTGTITGLKNGDAITASYATDATNTSNVGSYPITPAAIDSTPAKLANYNVTLVNANLTISKATLTITADNKSRQYSDPSPALTVSYSGFVRGQTFATSAVTGAPLLSTTITAGSPASTMPITASLGTLASGNYQFSFLAGVFTVTQEDAALVYTGDSLISTGSTATSSTKTVQLSASVTEAADGYLGNQLGNQSVVFAVSGFNGVTAGSCTARITVPATYTGAGTATCNVTLGEGNYMVDMVLVANGYYLAPHETGAVTVVLAGTGFTTGGGWIREPTLGTKSNFGFTVKYLKNGNVQGNSLYIYRQTLAANLVANPAGGFLPAGDYNWIVKSNSMTGLTQKCPSGTLIGCTATFTGKSTITAASRATGLQYSLGGNNSFQVDVTDKGEPGSSSATTPDTYALRVWDVTGTYYQLGAPTAQLSLNGGNIQVRP